MTLFPKQFSIQSVTGSYVDGIWTRLFQPATFIGSVQPASGKDLEYLPEGRRDKGGVTVYSDTRLNVSTESGSSSGDLLIWNGRLWEIVTEFIHDSGIISHFKYMAVDAGAQITIAAITPDEVSFAQYGDQLRLVPTFSDGADHSADCTWTTSDALAATVDPTGLVTAVGFGPATITCSYMGQALEVPVEMPPVLVDLSGGDDPVAVGATATILAMFNDGLDHNDLCGWASSDEGVATVADGVVTGIAAGTATITASLDAVTLQVTVTVEAP